MQITDITIAMHERSSPSLAVFGTRDGKLPMGVLRIETDEGIAGTDFLSYPGPGPEAIGREIVTFVKPLLLGADPLEIGRHWRRLCRDRQARLLVADRWRAQILQSRNEPQTSMPTPKATAT